MDDAAPPPKPEAQARRKPLLAKPQPHLDPVEVGKAIMARYPKVMARLAE